MSKQIHYQRRTTFLGRNGEFKQDGLLLTKVGDEVTLTPITSKNQIGRAMLCVPQGSIPELIDTLRLFLEGGSDTTPIK